MGSTAVRSESSRADRRDRARRGRTRRPPWQPDAEALEGRVLLATVPIWVAQGPGPLLNGQPQGLEAQGNPVAGAIQSVAPHPTDANILYVGTTSGGIWKTSDATSLFPHWKPLTDDLPTLSIGDITISPLDSNTVYAGTGSFSNGSFGAYGEDNGGLALGVLKSTDAGASWTLLGTTTFTGLKVRRVLPTTLLNNGQQVILATAEAAEPTLPTGVVPGLYRSTDGGQSWTILSGDFNGSGLPFGRVDDVVEVPNSPGTLFTAVFDAGTASGVYRSTDGGQTWEPFSGTGSNAIDPTVLQAADNLRLAAVSLKENNQIHTRVYLLTAQPGTAQPPKRPPGVSHVYVSNGSNSWIDITFPSSVAPNGINNDDQEGNNLAIAAELGAALGDADIVFITGSAAPTDCGSRTMALRAEYVPGAASAAWQLAVCEGARGNPSNPPDENTIAHSDSRTLRFDAAGNLLLTDDGGIYRLVNPTGTATQRYWVSVNGDIQPTEFYGVAYDSIDHVLFGGSQDNSSGAQTARGNTTWVTDSGGDVTHVAADASGTAAVLYSMGDDFSSFFRGPYSSTQNSLTTQVALANNSGGGPLSGLNAQDRNIGSNQGNATYIPFVLNALQPTRLLVGLNGLYESFNQGDVITEVTPSGATGLLTAVAYGGRLNGSDNPAVAYAGYTTETAPNHFISQLYVRSEAGGSFLPLTAFAGPIRQIALDPDDWRTAYVTAGGRVYQVTGAGTPARTVTDISGNLAALGTKIRAIALYNPTSVPGDEIVLVGGLSNGAAESGGVFLTSNPYAGPDVNWTSFGMNLPRVQVMTLVYSPRDNVLAAGSFGRGAWAIDQASTFFPPAQKVVSETRLLSSLNPAPAGVAVTLLALVTAANPAAGVPTGQVTFYDGAVSLGSATVLDGAATLTTAALQVGSHLLRAVYDGGVRFAPSTSATVTELVDATPDGPRVTAVDRSGVHFQATSIVLTFNQALVPTTAQNPANYRLVLPGRPNRSGVSRDLVFAFRSIRYDAATRTVTLIPRQRLRLNRFYQLTLRGLGPGAITNTAGLALDGAGNGRPGSDFTVILHGTGPQLLSAVSLARTRR